LRDAVFVHTLEDGRTFARFIYKTANLVGRLGDNGNRLREAITDDALLWDLASSVVSVNIIAHTRWASNGIINLDNCHPVDGQLENSPTPTPFHGNPDALFVLNGDVDNYPTLVESVVEPAGCRIAPSISTDAKILPVLSYLTADKNQTYEQTFRSVLNRCSGSLAVVMQHPNDPDRIYLGQKGSGQSLFAAKTQDGWIVASEVYGLAPRARRSYPMAILVRAGLSVELCPAKNSEAEHNMCARYLQDGASFEVPSQSIDIFSRDVYRGDWQYYIEKEIHEAPDSVRKTLAGKLGGKPGARRVLPDRFGRGLALQSRLKDPSMRSIRRIIVIGQGTAAIAGMGIAYFIRKSLRGSGISIEHSKACELFGFLSDGSFEDLMLVAVSQSGTTTDTNRVVDLAREQGAWVHAIVNRRNSPLVQKANSHIYTSNGRDVEMSVASTKAFYSQIAAGKLLALFFAQAFETLSAQKIAEQIDVLESLPDKIQEVLGLSDIIAKSAQESATGSRYWAVVGNGPNRIAAQEIRIKLSELCYKSIPCDVTEDKKHIDLSTEPLTLVIANDLPEMVVQDTVKEVAIFKAHNGRPIVFCNQGENRFDSHAHQTIKLPPLGADLAFVPATVAGHLWGIEAAKAIDHQADSFRTLRNELTDAGEHPENWDAKKLKAQLTQAIEFLASGQADSSLPSGITTRFAKFALQFDGLSNSAPVEDENYEQGIKALNSLIEEMTRPIDTIRHQAKTVTVGISRPQKEIAPAFVDALVQLGITPRELKAQDRHLLEALSPFLVDISAGLAYKVVQKTAQSESDKTPLLHAVAGLTQAGLAKTRYTQPRPAVGTKKRVLRTGNAALSSGPSYKETIVVLPAFQNSQDKSSKIILLHLNLVQNAALQQKVEALRTLGSKYPELIEQKEERGIEGDLNDIIAALKPRDLFWLPVNDILREYRLGQGQ
jgi:glucosamine--fructose-6-phosphate aminotransferase (isomerizing)